MEIVAVPDTKGEMRLDSRALAERMGNEHASVMKLIDRNVKHFELFGGIGFEIQTLKTKGGKQESRCALLNEDQCYFLLTLVRNSDVTVPMKATVVAAFSLARQLAATAPAPQAGTPALITARAIAESMGLSRNAVLNRLSRMWRIPPVACGQDRQPCYLFPLEAVAEVLTGYQLRVPLRPYTGPILPGGLKPALEHARQGVLTRTGKNPRSHPLPIATPAPVTDRVQAAQELVQLEQRRAHLLSVLA